MIKNALIALLFFITNNCLAQQNYFVLIQADNNQPFYARLNDKILSSSDVGHLIIPQLKDSTYNVIIGFPKNIFPEQNFVITISKKDQSFQLKNLGEKGWGLFNTLTMELKMISNAEIVSAKPVSVEPSKKEDAFARLMAGVVNDTAIMHEHIVEQDEQPKKETETVKIIKKANIKLDTTLAANTKADVSKATKKEKGSKKQIEDSKVVKNVEIKPDSAVAINTKPEVSKTIKSEDQPIIAKVEKKENKTIKTDSLSKISAKTKAPLYRAKDTAATHKNLSFIKKLNEQKTDTALQVRYVDIPDKGAIDTVDIIIPFNEKNYFAGAKKEPIQKQPEEISNKETKIVKSRDTTRTLIDTSVPVTNKSVDSIKKDTTRKAQEVPKNKNCKSIASDYDIDKLRIKMLAIDNDDDKISTARTVFKLKCFSVKQVKALSEVFKTDEGKYQFFDAVYFYVSDMGNFIQLQDLLSDSYYVNRFKAMIR